MNEDIERASRTSEIKKMRENLVFFNSAMRQLAEALGRVGPKDDICVGTLGEILDAASAALAGGLDRQQGESQNDE